MQQSSRMPAGRGAAPSTLSITNGDKQKATAEVDDFCRVLFDFVVLEPAGTCCNNRLPRTSNRQTDKGRAGKRSGQGLPATEGWFHSSIVIDNKLELGRLVCHARMFIHKANGQGPPQDWSTLRCLGGW